MLLSEFRIYFRKILSEFYSNREIDTFFKILIDFYFDWKATFIGLNPNYVLDSNQLKKLKFALAELELGKPIQYVTNQAFFLNNDFYVNDSVLIPRPETEELVKWVLDDINEYKITSPHLMDIGTGSGCIAISLAKANREIKLTAIDLSKEALIIAKKNASKHKVKIDFVQEDIQSLSHINRTFDIIVSNPPYIHPDEKKDILPNVLNHEPHMAVFTPNNDPIYFYRLIINFASKVLKSLGGLYLEINPKFLELLKSNFSSRNFSEVEVRNDIFGKPRMLKVIKK
ncbi:MAG: protein-(glutamine-N5) methyltransferase, release factor-specific [Flavobacteriales bacterium]|nr:protein-(glutamine-N5) methyltransferase, release factor-specific [Flavobacteriales bacterium]